MRTTLIAAASAALFALPAAGQEEESWYPSQFGADDRLGAVNHLSADKVVAAANLVTEGKTYALGQVTGPDTPAYGAREYDVTILQLSDGTGQTLGANKATGNDDLVRTFVGIGSQLDGLGHMGIDHTYYNGVHASDFVATDGLKEFGTHAVPPIVTRGVLLDMTKVFAENPVANGTAFNREQIEAASAAQGVTIEKGDVVLFHTGFMEATADATELPPEAPGLGVGGAKHLAEIGVVAIGADTWGLEAIPFEDAAQVFPVHTELLAKNGVYILENMVTAPLAADGVSEFLFVLGQPRLEGTVQAIINPVAIR